MAKEGEIVLADEKRYDGLLCKMAFGQSIDTSFAKVVSCIFRAFTLERRARRPLGSKNDLKESQRFLSK